MFVVNSYSELEEALLLQVQELLLCGMIGEQVQAGYKSTNYGESTTLVHRKMIDAVRRHYDVVDFRQRGGLTRLLLSRHTSPVKI